MLSVLNSNKAINKPPLPTAYLDHHEKYYYSKRVFHITVTNLCRYILNKSENYYISPSIINYIPHPWIKEHTGTILEIDLSTLAKIVNAINNSSLYTRIPRYEYTDGKHLIHVSIETFNFELFMKLGEFKYTIDPYGRNILHLAYIHHNVDVIEYLKNTSYRKSEEYVSTIDNGRDMYNNTPREVFEWKKGIDRVDYSEEWDFDRYMFYLKPLIIENCFPELDWTTDRFIEKFGDIKMSLCSLPYINDNVGKNLKELVVRTDLTPSEYIFQNVGKDKNHVGLLNEIDKYISPFLHSKAMFAKVLDYQFYLGGINSGSYVHIHTDALNFLFEGIKEWYIAPFILGTYSYESPQSWTKKCSSRYESFIQKSGEMVYIPGHHAHAILNKERNIGFACEFSYKDFKRSE